MKILVLDVGGTHIKAQVSGSTTRVKIPSGTDMTPIRMVTEIKKLIVGWQYDAITIGYPGVVSENRIVREPHNLGPGWIRFNFKKAFGSPVKIVNDAAMQALGSHRGKRMLFLGLGTGLGSALVMDGKLIPLELAHLPYRKGRTYEEYIGLIGIKRLGLKKWSLHVAIIMDLFKAAFEVDYVMLGGGNARLLEQLPPYASLGNNANAFRGGYRLWAEPKPVSKTI